LPRSLIPLSALPFTEIHRREPLVSIVTAERRGAATDDGCQDLQVQPGEPQFVAQMGAEHDRFEHNQSVIFIALRNETAVGFTQLYPSFSSGALAREFMY